jgi:hypothetical protein
MVRRAATVALVAAFLAPAGSALAQGLARLTVQSFALASDTNEPRIDVPFHLILTLRVRERVGEITNVNLPILAELELLGDERETTSGPRGTQYRETITVVAHQSGAIAIAPATLQAIDARDGKPKQWYTNGLTLRVGGAPPHVLRDALHLLRNTALALFWVLLWLLGIGCIAFAAVVIFRRRRRPAVAAPAPVPGPPPPPPIVERSRRQQAEDALAVLRAERSRTAAVAVRAAIWRMVGASDGETLGDVMRRPESHDQTMRQLLIALERSAFTYEDDLPRAIEDACSALERYIGAAA